MGICGTFSFMLLRYLYSLLMYLIVPFALLRLLWRSRKTTAYRQRWSERFAFFKMPNQFQNGLWIHAVSVGEAMAAIPIIRELQVRHPDLPIVVTTMTVTGSERVTTLLGDSVFHVYLPYDLPCTISRFIKKVNPRLIMIMETEVWPNVLYYARKYNVPVLLANARMSERSAKGYMYFKHFIQKVFRCFSLVAAQAQADAERFHRLGVPQDRIKILGSVKFDIKQPASNFEAGELLRQKIGASRPVWIAASTRGNEEEIILRAFDLVKEKLPNALLLLVPRHPERVDKVLHMCQKHGYKTVLRSSDENCDLKTDVFLGDTMGEMMLFYAASDVAFVGGSLVPLGGQNMLEPASFGLPLITGPHLFNFEEAKRLLQEADAISIVNDEKELANQVIMCFSDVEVREQFGQNAKAVVDANRGALERHLKLIENLLQN